MSSGTRPLVSTLLNNASFSKYNRKKPALKFQGTSPIVFFQDRPGIKSTTLDWEELSIRKKWNKIFGNKATFHALTNNNELSVITIKKPKNMSKGLYSAKVKINQSSLPSELDNNIRKLSLFSDLNQNRSSASYASPNSIPLGSDFMGHIDGIKLSLNPSNRKITLRGETPFKLAHFSSNTVKKDEPSLVTLDDFSSHEQWNQLFGDQNPNSALSWRSKGQDFVLTFKQSKPKIKPNGSWTIQGKPLFENPKSSNNFFKTFSKKTTVSLKNPTLMIDSSGNNVTGTINWNDVSNAIDSLDSWLQQHPNALCDSVSGADALIGGLEGATAGAAAGVAAGGMGGAVTGLAILTIVGTVADTTGAPEVIGIAAGAVGGAAVGAATGSAALSGAMAVFDAGISGTICDYVTGETGSNGRIDELIKDTENLFTASNTIIDDISKAINKSTNISTNIIDDIKELL